METLNCSNPTCQYVEHTAAPKNFRGDLCPTCGKGIMIDVPKAEIREVRHKYLDDLACKTEVNNQLFKEEALGPDSFRQFYYPNLPTDYAVNPIIRSTIERMVRIGRTPDQIFDHIKSLARRSTDEA